MSNRLDGVLILLAVVEAGSFAGAAERLGLGRSAVAKSVARLEARLGVRLFHRTTRRQSLTDEGQAYFERCSRAVEEIDLAERALASRRHEPAGVLRVSAPVHLGRCCIAPALADLVAHHPGLQLEMRFTDRIVDLTDERIDLAIRIGPMADRAGLMTRKLGRFASVICGAPAYFARRGIPAGIAELADHDCLAYGRDGRVVPWPAAGVDDPGFMVTSRLRFDDLDSIADAAAAGLGIASLPCWLIGSRVAAGVLQTVIGPHRAARNDVFAVWPQTPHLPSKVRAAIDRLAAHIPKVFAESE